MFKVSIFDRERKLCEAAVSEVSLPGQEGELTVLEFHAPMISLLRAGQIRVDGRPLLIRKGIARMERNELLVLVER